MFHDIPNCLLAEMRRLEAMDARDRGDGTARLSRLRQIPPETGKFLALLAASAPKGQFVEIGTSAGYSALWLALACRQTGRRLTTFEVLPEKTKLAKETFERAQVGDVVSLVEGDARHELPGYKDIAFCFLDAEKEVYLECYEIILANMISGGTVLDIPIARPYHRHVGLSQFEA